MAEPGPLRAFAEQLRALRTAAGDPTYKEMAGRVHYSAATLARAADGRALPNWEVARAYVRACDGNEAAWRARWERTDEALAEANPGTTGAAGDGDPLRPTSATTPRLGPADSGPAGTGPAEVGPAEVGRLSIDVASPRARRPALSGDLIDLCDILARAVDRRWQAELSLRRVNDPHPLPVTWTDAGNDVVERWDFVTQTLRSPLAAPRLAGISDIAEAFAAVPTQRLLVLGGPGSGKSVLLARLALDLLARRRPYEPVPVLLPAASWNPAVEDLRTWLTGRLLAEHPALAGPLPGDHMACAVDALLDNGLVLLLLDGLDEIPEPVRAPVVARINDVLRPGDGIVVSSRTDAFRDGLHAGSGTPTLLRAACGVVLRDLDPAAVDVYLRRDAGLSAARWAPVLEQLAVGGPLADVLRTPRLVSLTRTAYNPRPGDHVGALPDPAELCDQTRFPTSQAVRDHLLDGFVPAARRQSESPPTVARGHDRPPTVAAGEAKRRLTARAVRRLLAESRRRCRSSRVFSMLRQRSNGVRPSVDGSH